jgi:hypothetical protein
MPSIIFCQYIQTILAQMSYNVPVIYDVFAVTIKEHEVFQQPQKCGGAKYHKGARADWYFAEPKPLNRRFA